MFIRACNDNYLFLILCYVWVYLIYNMHDFIKVTREIIKRYGLFFYTFHSSAHLQLDNWFTANCENERRVLSEKLESAKSALSELKRLNATLEDQVHRLTKQLADVEVQRYIIFIIIFYY